jgi:transcriptional regulator with XRE-family HTH domain
MLSLTVLSSNFFEFQAIIKIEMPRIYRKKLPRIDIEAEPIGARIARLRKERGLTQTQLADRLGIARILITDYERGKIRIYDSMVSRFAVALGISADEFLGLKNGNREHFVPSLRIMKRLQKIQSLPANQQKALLKTIDMVLKSGGK